MPLRARITCPRTDDLQAPCVARDGHSSLDRGKLCIMCRERPDELLRELGNRYRPAAEAWLEHWGLNAERTADIFRAMVSGYVQATKDREPASD